MFKVSIHSCIIILYIVENNIFAVIVYKLSVQKKYENVILKNALKLPGKQRIKMPKKGEYVTFNNYERKTKSPFMIYLVFEGMLVPEVNGKQNPE